MIDTSANVSLFEAQNTRLNKDPVAFRIQAGLFTEAGRNFRQ